MAEFALGLTKTAVEGTLSLVKSAIEEEKKLRDKVQNDLVFITGEFEVMQSFLQDDASREHARNNKVTLTLVRQLRTLAFDVEDCVEYVVHLDLDKSSIWGGLQRAWQTVNCRAPPLPLDVAVAEIKQLKARVEDVSQRNTRYNLILHGPDNKNNQKQLSAEEPPYATTTYPSSAAFHVLRDAWKATGKWSSSMCNLQQELLIASQGEDDHDHDLQVISIWGNGSTGLGGGGGGGARAGHGILTKAYYDPEVCENFKIRVWVKLTHPFNHDEFVKSLLAQFYASSSQQAKNAGADFCGWMKAEVIEADNLMKANNLMQQMSQQRYLVVLEDVLTMADWDVIRMYLPDSKNGSRILLSTPHLGIARLCTGEPYQVSELTNFSDDNQFLCAFFKKEKTSSDIGKFYRRLLRGCGVISVWGPDDNEISNHIDILYRGIINGWLEEIGGIVADKSDHVDMLYEGIRNRRRKFERWHNSWVDVPDPFDLKVFARRLFLNFHSDDIRASEMRKGGKLGEEGLVKWCRECLFEKEDCLVVINGLQSMEDWELITSTFFSYKSTTAKAGCMIIVVTDEETIAKHCVKGDHTDLAFNAKDLKADPSISSLIEKGCWHYAIRGKKGRLFYDRKKDAREWVNKFENVGGNIIDPDEGKDKKEGFRVFMVKRDQTGREFMIKLPDATGFVAEGGNSEKGVLRHAYYGALLQQQTEWLCSWVDTPCDVDRPGHFVPLDETDLTWRLLLDFYSDDPQAKEQVAVGLMEGTIIDPIEKCREFLHNRKCLVVINGRVRSRRDIRTFFSEHIQSTIFIHSTQRRIRGAPEAVWLDTQQEGRLIDMEYRSIFSNRKRFQEAIQWFEKPQLIGRDKEVWDLRLQVLNKNLVAVWGISGVGKSTLVRIVYYKEILYSSGLESSYGLGPTEAFAWVDIPSPFNLTDFAWRLLLGLYSDDPHTKESAAVSMVQEGCQVPILECCKILRTGKCLVVIDGVCSKQDWDLIKATFLAEPIKGTIVVITNEQEVAIHCVENDKQRLINITRLEANAAISLYEKIASKDKQLTPEEKVLSKSIVAKCGGLPKVITAIGEVCRYNRWWLQYLNDNFMGTLERDPEFHGLRPLFSWMQSCVDACSDSIKQCIFYLSIFPPEKYIRLRRLLWRWIAEGYCRDTSYGRTSEENGEALIFELVNWIKISRSSSNEGLCQIDGFFHEYISQQMEDNRVFALEGHCSHNSTRGGQHLTIRSSWDRNEIVYESIDFSRLRSLTVFGKWKPFFICSKKVNMRLLRVLDLEDATDVTNEDLDKIAKLLTRLKFLSLRGNTMITCLPISVGGLRQLQTLDIRGTSIVMLPLFITKLQKLRYIRAGSTEVWDWEGDIVEAADELNRPSAAAAEGDIVQADGEEDRAVLADGKEDKPSSSAQADTNLQAATTPPPIEGGTDSMGPVLPEDEAGSSVSCNNRAGTLVSSLLSKLCRHGGGVLDNNNGPAVGVTVPTHIGNLSVLHTLGVVKVNAQCGNKAIFQELMKLTQLRKLGVSGINKGNIHEFCIVISCHAHLKSLSVELDKDDNLDGLNDIPQPPKTLKSLKLYGRVKKLLVWIETLYHNLEKLKLDLTIEKPEELGALQLSTSPNLSGHFRIRPVQDGELHLRWYWEYSRVVEIQCSSVLYIKINDWLGYEVLKVHFSGGSQSSLQISGLRQMGKLKEVWLKGYTDEHKQYMQQQIDLLDDEKRPVLKLVQPCVTNSTSEPDAQANVPEAHSAHSRSRLAGVVTCCARVLGEKRGNKNIQRIQL